MYRGIVATETTKLEVVAIKNDFVLTLWSQYAVVDIDSLGENYKQARGLHAHRQGYCPHLCPIFL